MTPQPVLVYVDAPWAYFADSIEEATGDDWNDAPYDCNAGRPYDYRLKVAYDGPLETPDSGTVGRDRWVSVDQVNAGEVPWLADFLGGGRWNPVRIMAGVTVREFVALIEESGGHVWVPMDGVPWLERAPA